MKRGVTLSTEFPCGCGKPKNLRSVSCMECYRKKKFSPFDMISKIFKKVETNGECWEWTGGKCSGYGVVKFVKKWPIHRLVYSLLVGPIPEGMLVRHDCDNPPCINPVHLRIGTIRDNMDDRTKRGRSGGEMNGHHKLTWDKVNAIRSAHASKSMTYKELSSTYGICTNQVHQITSGRQWKRST